MPAVYATPADLRAELELDAAALPDAEATRRLIKAEDLVDRLIGLWPMRTTGRKLDPAGLSDTRRAVLNRVTVELAAALPAVDEDATVGAASVSGPDFTVSYGAGGKPSSARPALERAGALLDGAGLRRLSMRLT